MSDILQILNDQDLLTDRVFTIYKNTGGSDVLEVGWDSTKKWPYMEAKQDIEINYTYNGVICQSPYMTYRYVPGYIFPNNPMTEYNEPPPTTYKLLMGERLFCMWDLILGDPNNPGDLLQNNYFCGYDDFTSMNLSGTEGVKFDLRIQYNKGESGKGMMTYMSNYDYISVPA